MPETSRAGAIPLVQRLLEVIRSARVNWQGCSVRITVSIGGAVATADMTVSDLVARADEALYAAKTAGRNQSRFLETV